MVLMPLGTKKALPSLFLCLGTALLMGVLALNLGRKSAMECTLFFEDLQGELYVFDARAFASGKVLDFFQGVRTTQRILSSLAHNPSIPLGARKITRVEACLLYTSFTVAVACLFNIAGDLFLVAGLGMGAKGAAIATVSAQALSVLISLVVIWKRGLPFAFSLSHVRFFKDCLVPILKVGVPIALQDVLVHFSFLFIQIVVNGMGAVSYTHLDVYKRQG